MEFGCAGGDLYENMWFLNGIWVVWEEIHVKIYGFLMKLFVYIYIYIYTVSGSSTGAISAPKLGSFEHFLVQVGNLKGREQLYLAAVS